MCCDMLRNALRAGLWTEHFLGISGSLTDCTTPRLSHAGLCRVYFCDTGCCSKDVKANYTSSINHLNSQLANHSFTSNWNQTKEAGSAGINAACSTAGGTAVSLWEDQRSEISSLCWWTRYVACETPRNAFVALHQRQIVSLDSWILIFLEQCLILLRYVYIIALINS